MPPYTETDGPATVRQGKDCMPFTGALRRQMVEATDLADVTTELVFEDWRDIVSPSALERIRELMQAEHVSDG